MDKDIARILAVGGTNACRELERLYSIARHHIPEDVDVLMGIASALAEVGLYTLGPAFRAHPELKEEFEQRLAKYGTTT